MHQPDPSRPHARDSDMHRKGCSVIIDTSGRRAGHARRSRSWQAWCSCVRKAAIDQQPADDHRRSGTAADRAAASEDDRGPEPGRWCIDLLSPAAWYAVGLRAGRPGPCGAAGAAQLAADGPPLGDAIPCRGTRSRRSRCGRLAGSSSRSAGGLGEQLRAGADDARVGPGDGSQRRARPCARPGASDRSSSRTAAGRPVRAGRGHGRESGGPAPRSRAGQRRPAARRSSAQRRKPATSSFLSVSLRPPVMPSWRDRRNERRCRRQEGRAFVGGDQFPPLTDDANRHPPTASHPGSRRPRERSADRGQRELARL